MAPAAHPCDGSMRAELRGFYSPDVPDLDAYRPDDAECFQLQVTAFIGPAEEGRGEEMFAFTVCTPLWLVEHPPPKNFEFLRSTIIMSSWDQPTLTPLSPTSAHTQKATTGLRSR
jgi:hypothetical protein